VYCLALVRQLAIQKLCLFRTCLEFDKVILDLILLSVPRIITFGKVISVYFINEYNKKLFYTKII